MRPSSLALLVLLGALWGGSFVFMRVAAPALGPLPLAYTRVALAAIALLLLAFAWKRIPPLRTRWREFAVVGIVNSALPFTLFCFAELHVSASTGAILNATSPFFGALAAAAWLGEPLDARKIAGMVLGFAGVVLLVGWHPETITPAIALALAACLVASMCYALGSVYARKALSNVPSFAIACASQLMAALALAPFLPFTSIPGPITPTVAASVLALALGSTALAYLIYFRLIAEAGPQRALMVTFLVPVFGVLWGFLFLGEPLTPGMAGGGALVIAGTALALRRP